jgi:hypothetical protein
LVETVVVDGSFLTQVAIATIGFALEGFIEGLSIVLRVREVTEGLHFGTLQVLQCLRAEGLEGSLNLKGLIAVR